MNKVEKLHYAQIQETLFKKTLPNGLTVFLLPKANVTKSYGIFMTNYGSMHRTFVPIGKNELVTVPDGIAHFLEHKLFEKEDRDVFSDFMKYGASPNAYTSFTKTAYLFSATDNVKENVELLLDFVQDPYFSEASVEKEKGIIAQEIKMYDDEPNWRSYMGTVKNMYVNLPINIDIAGTVDSIQQITKEDLYMCYNTFYHPANMALFVAGNFDAAEMLELIEQNQAEKTFPEAKPPEVKFPYEPEKVNVQKETIKLPVSLPKLSLGIKEKKQQLKGEVLLRQDLIQQMILDHLFSKSGAYYKELYEKELIDDSFDYSTTVETLFNFTLISSDTEDPERLENELKEMLEKTKSLTIDEATFSIMKKRKMGEYLRSLNSLERIANEYLHYHFAEIDYFHAISILDTLTVDELNEHLAEWISEDRLTTFVITI